MADGPLVLKQVQSSTAGMVNALLPACVRYRQWGDAVQRSNQPPSGGARQPAGCSISRPSPAAKLSQRTKRARQRSRSTSSSRSLRVGPGASWARCRGWATHDRPLPAHRVVTALHLRRRSVTASPACGAVGVQPETVHALLLLQSYSNQDKHRAVRLALPRTIVQRSDVSFYKTIARCGRSKSATSWRVSATVNQSSWNRTPLCM